LAQDISDAGIRMATSTPRPLLKKPNTRKRHIKIIASGKIATSFDLVKNFALGADICCRKGFSFEKTLFVC